MKTSKTKFDFSEWKQILKTSILSEKKLIELRQADVFTEPKRIKKYEHLFRDLVKLNDRHAEAVSAVRIEIRTAITKIRNLIMTYSPPKLAKEKSLQIPTIVAKQILAVCKAHDKNLVSTSELDEFFKSGGELQKWSRVNKISFRLPEYTPDSYNRNKPIKSLQARLQTRIKKKN